MKGLEGGVVMSDAGREHRDVLGRRRLPNQSAGLKRSVPLPDHWSSRSVRIALPESDWSALELFARHYGADGASGAMALGQAIHRLLESHRRTADWSWDSSDWMEWERRTTLRLLRPVV